MRNHEFNRAMPLKDLLGTKIHNADGDELGSLEEVVVSLERSDLHYAILSFGTLSKLFGIGEKYFAVPWQLMKMQADGSGFLLDVPIETLKDAPGFDKEAWPELSDHRWQESVNLYYSMGSNWGETKL